MDTPDSTEPSPTEPPPGDSGAHPRPLWLRLARIVAVLVIVGLAFMAFASWYFTNTFDFVFGPPR